MESLSAFWRKHGSKILLVFAVAMLVFAGVRYKRNQEDQRQRETQTALTNAWRGVEQVQSQEYAAAPTTPAMIAIQLQIETDVNQAVQLVLDSADPSTDAPRMASAWLARGEMFWALAHPAPTFPSTQPVGPAASQPAASQPVKDYLSLAATAYGKIVSDYSSQIEPLTIARFGLGAVAEDRRDIAAARLQYQMLIDNPAVALPDKSMAETRLAGLNDLEKPLLLLPATQPVAVVPPAASALSMMPGAAAITPQAGAPMPTTLPSSQPMK